MIEYPEPIQKGDAIAIISPAGAVTADQLQPTLDLITERGYEPVLSENALGQYDFGYRYSGTVSQRTADLDWAICDPAIKAIWATRGGYGCQHLLEEIEIKKMRRNPKWYIGYSDNTVLQSYFLRHKIAGIHGQTIKTGSQGVSAESYSGIFDILAGQFPTYHLNSHSLNRYGVAEGILVGGNLSLIYALLATKYSFKFRNNILFIEEIGEDYYALDRMLMALKSAEVFDKLAGLIVGGMTNMADKQTNPNYQESFDPLAYEIIADHIKEYDFPVVYAFPNGHIFDNQPLVVGAGVHMTVEAAVQIRLY